MNKSKSSPNFQHSYEPSMKSSNSDGNLSKTIKNDFYFEEFFEGDGPLGITFNNSEKNEIFVERIIPNQVAYETYGLQPGMILIEVGNKNVTTMNYSKVMECIKKEWRTHHRVYLKFKKKIYPEISEILNHCDLFHYYDKFIELGAYGKDDIEFIERQDLIMMDMCTDEIASFFESCEYYISSGSK